MPQAPVHPGTGPGLCHSAGHLCTGHGATEDPTLGQPSTAQVNAFFLKYILWLPPLNPLNTYRLALLFLLALPATKVPARRILSGMLGVVHVTNGSLLDPSSRSP